MASTARPPVRSAEGFSAVCGAPTRGTGTSPEDTDIVLQPLVRMRHMKRAKSRAHTKRENFRRRSASKGQERRFPQRAFRADVQEVFHALLHATGASAGTPRSVH